MEKTLEIYPLSEAPNANIKIPGSKSHSNRALICAALSDGVSILNGLLLADDTQAMLSCLNDLGVIIDVNESEKCCTVNGIGGFPFSESGYKAVDARQSGTTARFILPLLAAGTGKFILDGHDQLRNRPIKELVDVLNKIGANISGTKIPLNIIGSQPMANKGSNVLEISGSVSSQYISGLMMASASMPNGLIINVVDDPVSKPYIDLTRHTMNEFGAEVDIDKNYRKITIKATGYKCTEIEIEPDASAASYFFAAAAVTTGKVRINGLGSNTIQGDLEFIQILEKMGCQVEITENWVEVVGTGSLNGVKVDMSNISDTAQTLAIVATFANTPTEITGIGFIRAKETNRVNAVATELNRLGINATETQDGLIIEPGKPNPGVINTYDDHRMAMSFSLLGLRYSGIKLSNPNCVNKTFPEFFQKLEELRN